MRAFTSLGLLAATAVLASAGAVSAGDQSPRVTHASPGRAVLICQTDAATRRAFTRDYGAAPVFVSAREVQSLRPSDPAWSAPRCMTEREHAKLRDAATANARVP